MKASHLRVLGFASILLMFAVGACSSSPSSPLLVVPKADALKPTCLVLSVGGAAGIAHLGAIESIRAHGVEVSCVVGNSMGSLVGALYASNPSRHTTEDFRALLDEYVAATKSDGASRAVVGGLVGLAALGPLGVLLGGAVGAVSVDRLVHDRLVGVLNDHLQGAIVETLPIPYATSYAMACGEKATFIDVHTGNVAHAVGASVANPFIFRELDVREGGAIDPGMDRVSAVPVEQTCAKFPDRRILAVNVMSQPLYTSRDMRCPTFEIRVAVPHIDSETVFQDPDAFAQMVAVGREAADAWFDSSEGRQFLASARRASPTVSEIVHAAPTPSMPQWYTVRVVSAVLAPKKPSGELWDGVGDGTADPIVNIEVSGEGSGTLRTPIVQDTSTPVWDFAAQVQLSLGATLEVTVWDMDALFHDVIFSQSVRFEGPKTYEVGDPCRSNELVIEITSTLAGAASFADRADAEVL